MLGGHDPITLSLDALQARYGKPELAASRRILGYAHARDLAQPFAPSGQLLSGKALREFIGEGLILTDDRPLLEYAVILIEWEKWTGQKIFGDLRLEKP